MKKIDANIILIAFAMFCISNSAFAQRADKPSKEERKSMLKDTLDDNLDFSRFLIDANGFIPIPLLITEPALGSFGGALIPAFIKPKNLEGYEGYLQPDITAAFGMYTANGSWALGAGRFGSFPKVGIKYRVFAGYADVNLEYYRTLPGLGERKFEFNSRFFPVSFSVSKKTFKQLYAGVEYQITPTKVKANFGGDLPSFVNELDLDSRTASIGVFLDWDSRNTVFTPDIGLAASMHYNVNASWTASDYEFQLLTAMGTWFVPVRDNWVSGVRVEVNHIIDNPPFYLLPSINLRGIPAIRYQGFTTVVLETEQRYDLNLRWSLVGFVGVGKAIQRNESFSDAKTVYNVGGGFRYLIARAFNARAGLDIGFGPDSWGYYIVFGHNWNR